MATSLGGNATYIDENGNQILVTLIKMQIPKPLKSVLRSLGLMSDPPITSYDQLVVFAEQNAAYVSQVTLYTYVKARAGTQQVKLFDHSDFVTSLRIARWHIFGAAVADITLFAAAQFHTAGLIERDAATRFAGSIMAAILEDYEQDDVDAEVFRNMLADGTRRANFADWSLFKEGDAAFQTSSDAIYRWAPIADELKSRDEEIIRNSMHLRWIGVRRNLVERLRPAEIMESWSAKAGK